MDDDGMELEERLRRAAERLDPVPYELLDEAMRAYALRALDAELAELTFDSWDEVPATRVRGGRGRLLTFETGEVVVELEVLDRRLVGRLSGGAADIEVQRPDGGTRLRSDELGRFTVGALAPGPLRLRVTRARGCPVVTSWIRI